MQLVHYSARPLLHRDMRSRIQDGRDGNFKPRGLWVSVTGEYDWKWWCESERFNTDRFDYATEIVLTEKNRVLHLKSDDDILAFTRTYQYSPYPEIPDHKAIDWRIVARHCDGIIIAPYSWELRLERETFWYYPWDCASGCIWNMDAVEALRPLPKPILNLEDDDNDQTQAGDARNQETDQCVQEPTADTKSVGT